MNMYRCDNSEMRHPRQGAVRRTGHPVGTDSIDSSQVQNMECILHFNPIPHGGGGRFYPPSDCLFITSVRDAPEPRNLVTFSKI